ncbi:MAG: DUF6580 family putative transport protein [Rubripirellula sp.]
MMFYALTLIVAASRFLPHPPNVACVGALGLFAGCYLAGRRAFLVPAVVLLISDIVGHALQIPGMGFYSPAAMLGVYGGATLGVMVGRWVSRANQSSDRSGLGAKIARIGGGSLAASTLFFVTSNLGVWMAGWYTMTIGGLVACYAAAIPFYGYTIAGDLAFTAVLFGAYQLSINSVTAGQPLVPAKAR